MDKTYGGFTFCIYFLGDVSAAFEGPGTQEEPSNDIKVSIVAKDCDGHEQYSRDDKDAPFITNAVERREVIQGSSRKAAQARLFSLAMHACIKYQMACVKRDAMLEESNIHDVLPLRCAAVLV